MISRAAEAEQEPARRARPRPWLRIAPGVTPAVCPAFAARIAWGPARRRSAAGARTSTGSRSGGDPRVDAGYGGPGGPDGLAGADVTVPYEDGGTALVRHPALTT
ncbi:hypothetical protein [Streptomyces sp. SP18CS02]|uniref:hypothetical protein n=1 Tax=Streptomyces sp. SP18CS02 TaxID=3002531 RepID=UPI002E799994|nr:hypothetical protein [Streptomyces sp. SP18CS02]MEE1753511.1 hypothetical protein [Streptomyces sp. SP18CS02]